MRAQLNGTNYTSISPIDRSHLVVLPDAFVAQIFPQSTPATLNWKEQKRLDALLQETVHLRNATMKSPSTLLEHVDAYYFQLSVAINEQGQKEVYINAFCQKPVQDWTRYLLSVEDRGSCYFSVKINLTTGTAYNLIINGNI